MGRYVDAVNKGIITLKENKLKETDFLEEYKTRKSLIEATYECDALGRNVLKTIEEDLIKITEENFLMIDEIINNEILMLAAAEKKEMDEFLALKNQKQELIESGKNYEKVEVNNTPVNASLIFKPKLDDKISMRSM